MGPKFDPNEIKVGMLMVSEIIFRSVCQQFCVGDVVLKLLFRT